MNSLNRTLTAKEIVLVVLLSVMLLGLGYYHFVYKNITESISSVQADITDLQTELDTAQAKAARLKRMEAELEGFKSTGLVSRMGSYNNSKMETAFLNTVLADVGDYTISFDDVTRDGDQIRRNFKLTYKAPSYDAAGKIMNDLTDGEYRCLIGDVKCSVDKSGTVNVSLEGTFYETMVGGVADSALPKDEAETQAAELDPTVEAAYSKN